MIQKLYKTKHSSYSPLRYCFAHMLDVIVNNYINLIITNTTIGFGTNSAVAIGTILEQNGYTDAYRTRSYATSLRL